MRAALLAEPGDHAALFADAHRTIARAIGLGAPDRLLLTSSCTQALSIAIGDLPWQAGDVVITSSLEHHALARPVSKLVHERGVVHERAPYAPGRPFDLEFAARLLCGGRVRLVAVTGACNVTGEVLPLATIADLAHRHDALLLLDAAQTAGTLPDAPGTTGADVVVFAGHKGLQGPLGIGGLWAAPHVRFTCPAAVCEIGSGGPGPALAPFPGFCDVGSVNLPAAAGLAVSAEWLRSLPPADRSRPLRLAARLHTEAAGRPHCRVLGGDGEHTGTRSFVIDGLPLERAEAHFAARGIVVRAGSHCAPMALDALGVPRGCLRIGFGPTNRDDDVDAVLAAIDAVRPA
ncbi:MAG: aminotransferase class V-fold PLP-dependent enzyme [Planctomycetes bacterium]|nr:aminotransferase class V-fold PLP-dependent enzyme [Planctomycetota bacterium]